MINVSDELTLETGLARLTAPGLHPDLYLSPTGFYLAAEAWCLVWPSLSHPGRHSERQCLTMVFDHGTISA